MDKKGFIRTLEAVIAIIIVFVFIYVLMQGSASSTNSSSESIKSMEENVLRGLSENEDLRSEVINFGKEGSGTERLLGTDLRGSTNYGFVKYVEDSLPTRFKQNYALVVCNVNNNCGIPSSLPSKEVYTTAVIITSSLESNENYNPKIVRLWVW